MNRYLFPIICSFILSPTLPAQPSFTKKGTSRAVIIGISQYEDELIENLKFADKDALAFKEFLQTKPGGKLAEDQIIFLSNEEATGGEVYAALDWLLEVSQPNDKAWIYFSGHGDVESKTVRQRGYLLVHNTTPTNYRMSAIKVEDLDDIIATLSLDNESEVVLITDACRSGKLAGNQIGGAQATAREMQKQFANEVRILSCQANEFSIEGERWGGGRGVFSYYLIDGLTGFANIDEDLQINLFEIEKYLSDNVYMQTAGSQLPQADGDKKETLAFIDKETLARLEEQRNKEKEEETGESIAAVANKGQVEKYIQSLDTSLQRQYYAFKDALEKEYFIPDDQATLQAAGPSASEWFDDLGQEKEMAPVRGYMLRDLSKAMYDKAQEALNAYIRADNEEFSERVSYGMRETFSDKYDNYPKYLSKVAELLGPDHYRYDDLLAKKYYFSAVMNRIKADQQRAGTQVYRALLDTLALALQYEDKGAYIYSEMGVLHSKLKNWEEAITQLEKAAEITPTWAVPYSNLCYVYYFLKDYEAAETAGLQAIRKDSNFYNSYVNLGFVYMRTEQWEKAEKMFLKGVEKLPDNSYTLYNLSVFYFNRGLYDRAEQYCRNAIAVDPQNPSLYRNIGYLYLRSGKDSLAVESFYQFIQLDSARASASVYIDLGLAQLKIHDLEGAESSFQKVIALDPGNHWGYYNIACIHSIKGDTMQALEYIEKSLQKAARLDPSEKESFLKQLQTDADLEGVRKTPEFETLISSEK